jgi:hypothetical protein
MTLKIFLDDKSFHCLKQSIPPGSRSKSIIEKAVLTWREANALHEINSSCASKECDFEQSARPIDYSAVY